MKKMILAAAALLASLPSFAQISVEAEAASERYSQRYDLLVSKLGPDGVGIETLLENWEKTDPDNRKLVLAKYAYYLTKSGTSGIVGRRTKKYLGNEPLFSLKDSTGTDMYYFEEVTYDDSLYTEALKNIDRAIRLFPLDLELRFAKAAALTAYEKESPDMALACLEQLADDYYAVGGRPWKYGDADVDGEFFESAMQEYCYTFYNIGSKGSYEAFRALSEKMVSKVPLSTMFLSNLGSYWLVVAKNSKKALKYYNKVLKIKPDDYTAAKNCVLLARMEKNTKLEKKYLPVLIGNAVDETEKRSAEARLQALRK